MKHPIEHQSTFLALLDKVAQESNHKTALANGKFKRDYGNVLYFTQNRTRANQLNILLAQEVATSAEKAIIPPAILPYSAGFVRLAALAKFGYVDSLNVCRYSDEWFNLFLYEVAKAVVPETFFADEFGTTENKRANLAKDFRVFIRDVVLHLKTNAVQTCASLNPTADLFLAAYRAYREEEKKFPNADNQFIHPLQAYEYLYAHVQNREQADIGKVIIVENEDLLEPLFSEILEKLNCPVYVLQDTQVDADGFMQKTDLYHFMTPLDEAEFIGWRIKKLLTQATPSTDIGVVCADRASKEVIENIFKRMDIAGEQMLPMAANGYYRLVKMLFSVIYGEENASLCTDALFADDKSKFKLGRGFYIFQKMLAQKGLKSKLSPADALLKSINMFLADNGNKIKTKYKQPTGYDKDFKALSRLKELLVMKNPSVSKIAEYALNDTKDKALINDIMAALYELDENLKAETDGFIKKAHTLFGILDGREINTPRQELALEQAPAAENEQESSEPEPNYSFSVVSPELAKTLRVKHLFLCGFNAKADNIGLLCYPNALAEKLQLPTINEKKKRAAQSVEYALNYAAQTAVSYAYLSLEGKETGQGALVQLLRQILPAEKQHIGKDNHLLKSYEVIDNMPDPSWTGVQEAEREEKHLQNFTEETLFAQTQTCGKLLEQIIESDAQGRRAIAAKTFADFIICPSKFFFALLAKYCGMDTADAQGVARMSKGTFWHNVFEYAAAKKIFYGQGEAKIKESLERALDEVVKEKEEDIGKFDANDKDAFLAQAKKEVVALFARNEAARQEKRKPIVYEGLEEKFNFQIPACNFDIHGKVDRKDQCEDGSILFWDYKTGKYKAELMKFYSTSGLAKKQEALQLAIYMYCYAKACQKNNQQPPKMCAGNIFINGKDNMGPQEYDAQLEALLDKEMTAFVKCLQQPLSALPRENKVESDLDSKCNYCDFREACNVISKYARGKND